MVRARHAVTALAAAALAVPAAAAAQDAPYPDEKRPHSKVTFRDLDGVMVRRMQATVVRRGGRLDVRASTNAVLRQPGINFAVLRISRCTGGSASALRCAVVKSTKFTVQPSTTSPGSFRASMAVPPRKADAIRVTLERSDRARTAYGVLELHGEAWRRPAGGQTFGAQVTPHPLVDVRQLRLDAVGISDGAVRLTERWTALASGPAAVRWQCLGAGGCAPRDTPLTPGQARTEQLRPVLRTTEAVVGMSGTTTEGAPLFAVTLPRPMR